MTATARGGGQIYLITWTEEVWTQVVGLALYWLVGERRTDENKHVHVMISNHKHFIEAIREKTKVCLRFYSKADSGVIDLVCAPLDYGPGAGIQDGVSRYWFWDYTSNNGSHTLSLLPEQVLDLRVLGAAFDPPDFGVPPPTWSIPRDWKASTAAGPVIPSTEATRTQSEPSSPATSRPVNN